MTNPLSTKNNVIPMAEISVSTCSQTGVSSSGIIFGMACRDTTHMAATKRSPVRLGIGARISHPLRERASKATFNCPSTLPKFSEDLGLAADAQGLLALPEQGLETPP